MRDIHASTQKFAALSTERRQSCLIASYEASSLVRVPDSDVCKHEQLRPNTSEVTRLERLRRETELVFFDVDEKG